jgi:hypothetical protein
LRAWQSFLTREKFPSRDNFILAEKEVCETISDAENMRLHRNIYKDIFPIYHEVILVVWTIATLGIFDFVEDIEEKLSKFQYSRKEILTRVPQEQPHESDLKSAIQLAPPRFELPGEIRILSGLVIDEYVVKNAHHIEQDTKGNWIVKETEPFVDTRWAEFWLTTESIILVERKDAREFVFRVISQALASSDSHIHSVFMDIEKIADDHPGHWLGSIVDRAGNMQNATMFGTDLEDDNVIGDEYVGSHKNQVGFVTEYFGAPVKVRVTADGTIIVLKNLSNSMGEYIQYIRQNLLRYATII